MFTEQPPSFRASLRGLLAVLGLLGLARYVRNAYWSLRFIRPNSRYWREGAPDGQPIPPFQLRILVAASPDIGWFLDSGRQAAESIRDSLQRNGLELSRVAPILDFGCGCGRVRTASSVPAPMPAAASARLRRPISPAMSRPKNIVASVQARLVERSRALGVEHQKVQWVAVVRRTRRSELDDLSAIIVTLDRFLWPVLQAAAPGEPWPRIWSNGGRGKSCSGSSLNAIHLSRLRDPRPRAKPEHDIAKGSQNLRSGRSAFARPNSLAIYGATNLYGRLEKPAERRNGKRAAARSNNSDHERQNSR